MVVLSPEVGVKDLLGTFLLDISGREDLDTDPAGDASITLDGKVPDCEERQAAGADENDVPENPEGFFMTCEEVASIENLSLRDKLTGLSILSRMEKDQIERICSISEGGVTFEEAGVIRQILEKYLSDSEIDTLNDILLRNKRVYAQQEASIIP